MIYTTKTIKKALDNHFQNQNAVSFSNLKDEITGFEIQLQKILEKPNVYCNNCKDLSAENLLKKILGVEEAKP